ncbi:Serine/threonine-protein kinase PknD [Pontiella desulfatans]|uniref:Serine/threonine-protein kinase PknD n=1 Tax=Pontiella desulfatans TaxID=2750659 RepID=A0A6C2TY36_PONDE|nr:serine/threonine-protein kinase [Pontiella desulfatans]VGO12590.1 Serine/threonine-protein kinase PknD [Pontiella desulfatans]
MDHEPKSDPSDAEIDPALSVFYSLAKEEIPPHERSLLYNEVRTIGQRYCDHVKIASGGLKRISKVYDRKTGRHVAFASLRDPQRKELFDPFLREARLTGALHHPNIIPVYDLGLDENGEPFFIMELKTGNTLAQIITEGHKGSSNNRSLDDLLGIFLKICEAMAYAHSRNILHLDLKPENIQVGEFGEVIICDWGLAKIISTPEDVATEYMEAAANPDLVNTITLNGSVKGTPGYMAPEQVSSSGKKNYTTDIYGLGAILYSILAGKPPLEGEVKEVLEKTRNGTIRPPAKVDPDVPEALSAVAMKAMRSDCERRYQCVEHLISDIQKYTHGFATTAENAGILRLVGLLYNRHRAFFISAALALLAFSGLSAVYLFRLSHSRAIALEERNRARNALEKMVEEQRVSETLRGNIGRTALDAANLFWKEPIQNPAATRKLFTGAIAELDRALEHEPDNEMAWAQKGFICFLMQRFSEASECFAQGEGVYSDLKPLCRRYAEMKSDEFMTSKRFAELVADVAGLSSRRSTIVELLLLYDFSNQGISDSHIDNVQTVIESLNPEWRKPVFIFSRREGRLLLGGDGLKTLHLARHYGSGKNMLRTLRLKHLEFADTDLSDLRQLCFLPVGSLDISQTEIHSLKQLFTLKSLIELTIREGQFSPQELNSIHGSINVITLKDGSENLL